MANCRGNSKHQINSHNNHPNNWHIIYQTHCRLVHLDGCFILVRAVVILYSSMIWRIRPSVRTILNLREGFLIFHRELQHTGLVKKWSIILIFLILKKTYLGRHAPNCCWNHTDKPYQRNCSFWSTFSRLKPKLFRMANHEISSNIIVK